MKIKLIKDALMAGIRGEAGGVYDVVDLVGKKLIDRGYAMLDDGKVEEQPEPEVEEKEDGVTPSE